MLPLESTDAIIRQAGRQNMQKKAWLDKQAQEEEARENWHIHVGWKKLYRNYGWITVDF